MNEISPFVFTVQNTQEGQRLDKVLRETLPSFSRAHLQKLLESGCITMNGLPAEKNARPAAGATVCVQFPPVQTIAAQPQAIALDIAYEDDDLLVVNKPRGIVVHPAAGNPDGTLVNALLYHCGSSLSGINGVLRPGIVHRIDKDTSGLLLVAKNDFAHKDLAEQIKAHTLIREYRAVVHGHLKQQQDTVDAAIGRSEKDRKKMSVTARNSRNAVTHFTVLEEYPSFSYLCLRLETGRTHQIRVHMAYIGHPVAGDLIYGPKKDKTGLGGQCLHAALLGFVHPRSGETIKVTAALPLYFQSFLDSLTKTTTV